jgi:hypothetical protein
MSSYVPYSENQVKASKYVPYPETDNPDFNKVIASKKEFVIHTQDKQDKSSSCDVATRFRLTPNQKIIKGFLSPNTPYNGVLLFHGTGTGKTCSAISMAEQFNSSFTKKHLVLVSGNLKDNFKKEIFDASKITTRPDGGLDLDNIQGCTGSSYVKGIPDRHRITKDTLDSKVRRLVNERWQMMAYGEFFNEYQKLKDSIEKITKNNEALSKKRFDRALAELYSDRVVIIDEAHTLRVAGENTKKRVPPIVEHMLRAAKNVKLILLTATPMYNYGKEIVYLLSLLLLNDKRIDRPLATSKFFENDILTTEGQAALIEYSRGYVSFVSASDPKTFPARLFPSINKDKNLLEKSDLPTFDVLGKALPKSATESLLTRELIKSFFGKSQIDTYERVRGTFIKDLNDVSNSDDDEGTISRQAIVTALEVSNIAFPSDISFGADGFNSCFIRTSSTTKEHASWSYQPAMKKKHGEFLDGNLLEKHASKMKRIIDYILSSEGIVYVYTNYVFNGALPLALALEHVGFKKHGGVCLLKNANISNKARNMNYIILSANDDISPNNIKEIAMAKSAENTDGSKIKVIIGTSVATEGIDFKAIREVHIMEPWYNFNKLEQVFGRAIRHCSHAKLTKEKRNVTIYQHVNILPQSKTESVDLRVYRIADEKQKSIDEIEGILKSTSIDCLLSPSKAALKVKNMITSQNHVIEEYDVVSKSTRCDASAIENEIDASTFHKKFIEDDVLYAKEEIKQLYKSNHVYDFKTIAAKCKLSDEITAYALNDMISHRDRILDRLGNVGILDYKSDKYLFQPIGTQYQHLTVEQRAPDAWQQFDVGRMKIDLKMLPRAKDVKPVNNANDNNAGVNEIISVIESDVEKVAKLFPDRSMVNTYKQQLYDYVIDRLDGDQMVTLVQKYDQLPNIVKLSIDNTRQIYRIDGKIYCRLVLPIVIKDEVIFYLVMKAGKLEPCGVRDTRTVKELESERKESIIIEFGIDTPQSALAFITPDKLKHRFKLIRSNAPKSTGTICAVNSELKKDTMISMITDISADAINNTAKRTKDDLCSLYEVVLRKHNPLRMLRPYIYHLISKKNEST